MSLQSQRELNVTREKLRLLKARFTEDRPYADAASKSRELSRRSLTRLINQLRAEITDYESKRSTDEG